MVELTPREIMRYDRQIRIDGLGIEGQKKLKSARVLVAGLGGLGCPASIYLAAAGIGELIIVDKERVELSNLNRQILHWEKDIDKFKVDSALEKLREINSDIEIKGEVLEIDEENIYDLIKKSDIVIDGMDNFKTRFIINKACWELKIPFIHAAIHGLIGNLLTIIPNEGPCLQCLIPQEPPEVKPFPVLGATPAIMATLQVMEAIKIITGIGKPAVGKLIIFDGWSMEFSELKIKSAPDCRVCGNK